MAYRPTLLPILAKFGLSQDGFQEFLSATRGFVAGTAASSGFFGKTLEDGQDLEIFIPNPGNAGNADNYFELLGNYVRLFFTTNQGRPTEEELLGRAIDEVIDEYCGFYKAPEPVDLTNEYNNVPAQSINTFTNPFTGRRIKVIYTYDSDIENILSKFDLDVCQFWSDGSDNFCVYAYNSNPHSLAKLRRGYATILVDPNQLTEHQIINLQSRLSKYKNLGYEFTVNQQPQAPEESFWQDLIFTSSDYHGDPTNFRKNIYNLFKECECIFQGSEMVENTNIILNFLKEFDPDDSDNWEYTWRFTWDADNMEDNIYLRKMVMLNPY